MEANVLGNGKFDRNGVDLSIPTITCNFLNLDLNPIATATWDYKAISKVNLNEVTTKILAPRLIQDIDYPNKDLLVIVQASTVRNSGQLAAEYLIQQGYTRINLYGITSRFKCDLSSESDKYYPKRTDNAVTRIDKWNKVWDQMINSNTHVEFNFVEHNQA